MGGLLGGGGGTVSTADTRIGTIAITQSTYGIVVPVVFGTTRLAANMIDYVDFTAIPHTTRTTSGGKGGGGGVTTENTTYTYEVATILSLGEGPIQGVKRVWKDKEVHGNLSDLRLTAYLGTADQLPWSYMQSCHDGIATGIYTPSQSGSGFLDIFSALSGNYTITIPSHTVLSVQSVRVGDDVLHADQYSVRGNDITITARLLGIVTITYTYATDVRALNYPYTAYVASPNFELSSSASMPTLNFEVAGHCIAAGRADAEPADIIQSILADSRMGVGFPVSALADMTDYRNYCRANGIYFSAAYDSQTEAQELITNLLQASNAAPVWSQGKLKLVPYGLEAVTANGATYTPPQAPLYDITLDDLVYDEGQTPIIIKPNLTADRYNMQSVEYMNRANDYNVEPLKATDDADISQRGIRPADDIEMHFITLPEVAQFAAQSIMQRHLYVPAQYEFTLTWRHCLIDPMDVITLTDTFLGLCRQPVRIVSIEEDEEMNLKVTAEDCPEGINSPTVYTTQSASRPRIDYTVDPMDINDPVIFAAPNVLAASGLETWMGLSGSAKNWGGCHIWASDDGSTYKRIGKVSGPSRMGVLLTALPAGNALDNANTLQVQLTGGDELVSGTEDDRDNLRTLCYVDGEFIAYEMATLIGQKSYALTGLRRGCYDTAIAAHAAGTEFARADDALFKYPYARDDIGKKVYLKFTSFNIYQSAEQSLVDVKAYDHTLRAQLPPDVTTLDCELMSNGLRRYWWTVPAGASIAGYRFKYTQGTNINWDTAVPMHGGLVGQQPYESTTVRSGTHTIMIKAVDHAGNESANMAYCTVDFGDMLEDNVLYREVLGRANQWDAWKTNGIISADGCIHADTADSFWSASGQFIWTSSEKAFWTGVYTAFDAVIRIKVPATGAFWLSYDVTGPFSISWEILSSNDSWNNANAAYWSAASDDYWSNASTLLKPYSGKIQVQAGDDILIKVSAPSNIGKETVVKEIIAIIDVPDRQEHFENIVIPKGGMELDIKTPSYYTTGVRIDAVQSSSTSILPIPVIVSRNPCFIKLVDSAGNPASATIDVTWQGFQKEVIS